MTSYELASEIASNYGAPQDIAQGGINTVAITNHAVVKVPVDRSEWRLAALAREHDILRILEEVDLGPYNKPELVDYSEDPAYLVTTYVPGATVATKEIRSMPTRDREALGRGLGAYILTQTAATDNPSVIERVAALPARDRTTEFESVGSFVMPEQYPTLTNMCQALFTRWQSYKDADLPTHFIHGDLTPHNLVFTPDLQLSGAIDFARAHNGTIAEELSTVCDIDTLVFEACIKELRQGGMTATAEHARTWRDMKYLHVGPSLFSGQPNYQGRIAFKEAIEDLYPDLDWQELDSR